MNINGEYGLIGDSLTSIDSTAKIELSDNEINLEATNVLVNGQAIGVAQGYVTNPLSSNLNCNNKNLTNVDLINGLDIEIINSNLNDTMTKTIYIDSALSLDGTHFISNVYADKFITSDTQPPRYLMSDGTELTNSGNNAGSNIYLYNNNNTLTPIPANGQIRFNQSPQPSATQLFISHRTRDAIDIENPFLSSISALSIIYIQDQDVSENYIRFNVNSAPVIVVGSYVTLNVSYLDSNGTGDTNFGAGMNIILSIFSNDIEIDTRLSNVETKTQNQSATANETIFNKYTTVILREAEPDFFLIKGDGNDLKFSVGRTNMTCGENMNMANNIITAMGPPVNPNDAARKAYVDDLITPLQTKTQNITATASENVFDKSSSFVLRVANSDSFVIRNDDSPASVAKFIVSNTSVQIVSVPLLMNTKRITLMGEPVDATDAATKNYVDNSAFVKSGTLTAISVPYFTSTNTLSGSTRNLFIELGVSTIQSGIDTITFGGAVGGSVTVSSGASTENVICSRQNYTLTGAFCPPFTQTTQITGNLTIGSSGFLSTRVRVSHMKFVGNLIFDNSTNQQLRTYFYNCDWNGTVTFPTSAATGTNGTQIFFDGCSFSGASAIVIPNQSLYTIFFTRCAFIGQTITNNQVIGNTTKLVFTDCSYLPTLSTLGNCVLNGLNTTLTTTQANFGSIVLGGLNTQLVRGDGSLVNSSIYSQAIMTGGSFSATFQNATVTLTYRLLTNFDNTKIVHLYVPVINTTIPAATNFLSSTTTALPVAIRPSQNIFNICRVIINNVSQAGICAVGADGGISFTSMTITGAFIISALANGTPNIQTISYIFP